MNIINIGQITLDIYKWVQHIAAGHFWTAGLFIGKVLLEGYSYLRVTETVWSWIIWNQKLSSRRENSQIQLVQTSTGSLGSLVQNIVFQLRYLLNTWDLHKEVVVFLLSGPMWSLAAHTVWSKYDTEGTDRVCCVGWRKQKGKVFDPNLVWQINSAESALLYYITVMMKNYKGILS